MEKREPKKCVLVFARVPEKGRVKTRLEKRLNRDVVLSLYKKFVEDILDTLITGGYETTVCYLPPGRGAEMVEWLGPSLTFHPQTGEDLGERMQNAFSRVFAGAVDQAVLIGADFPDLDLSIIDQAFDSLFRNDMTLGPAVDGGYYLIGFNRHTFSEDVFKKISWGTGRVFAETLERAQAAATRVHILPEWRDIDTFEDLELFYRKGKKNGLDSLRTMQYLHTILATDLVKLKRFLLIPVLLFLLLSVVHHDWNFSAQVFARDPDRITVGDFSSHSPGRDIPVDWQPLKFDNSSRHTRYELVKIDDVVAVKAESMSSASGLIRKIEIDPREYPIVEWHWKIAGVLKKGDATRKKGDDYPARLYINFVYDASLQPLMQRLKYSAIRLFYGEYPPAATITYIWGNRSEKGAVIPSPYTARAMMFVVESGENRVKQWVREERNVLSDYREAFNTDPPMISSVAIMTDTDDTGEAVTAYYGDITFRKK